MRLDPLEKRIDDPAEPANQLAQDSSIHRDHRPKKITFDDGRLKANVVVNCVALCVPRACEMDPAATVSINLPSSLVNWLSSFNNSNSLLVHLSTDQVYEGVKSFYKEEDEAVPVNMYGKTKLAAKQHIIAHCSNYAILRSNIIYGPQTISLIEKSLPI
ncbi:hypothetical protein ZIOFF_029813 [Zingiber officinale]|uniref:RmlD-like substrate binding domain-containing protein n=1 Tax=Zingiber officinale TaxID=94328 RepID=A0A8J5LAW4_ZINOF|nr:hypothetical protein ZIOFF_029813 [Zingiber officinale]